MSDYSNRDEWSNERIIGEYVTTRLALNGTWIPSLYDNWINKSKELYAELLRRMDATCRVPKQPQYQSAEVPMTAQLPEGATYSIETTSSGVLF